MSQDYKRLESFAGGPTVGVWSLFVVYLFIFGQSLFILIQKYMVLLTLVQSVLIPKPMAELGY